MVTDELITLNRLLHNDFNWRQSVCYESLCLSVLGQIFYVLIVCDHRVYEAFVQIFETIFNL